MRACEALIALAPSIPSPHSEAFKAIAAVFRDTVGGRSAVDGCVINSNCNCNSSSLSLRWVAFWGVLMQSILRRALLNTTGVIYVRSLGPIVSVFFVRMARSLAAAHDTSAAAFAAAMMEGCHGITGCDV